MWCSQLCGQLCGQYKQLMRYSCKKLNDFASEAISHATNATSYATEVFG